MKKFNPLSFMLQVACALLVAFFIPKGTTAQYTEEKSDTTEQSLDSTSNKKLPPPIEYHPQYVKEKFALELSLGSSLNSKLLPIDYRPNWSANALISLGKRGIIVVGMLSQGNYVRADLKSNAEDELNADAEATAFEVCVGGNIPKSTTSLILQKIAGSGGRFFYGFGFGPATTGFYPATHTGLELILTTNLTPRAKYAFNPLIGYIKSFWDSYESTHGAAAPRKNDASYLYFGFRFGVTG